MHLKIASMTEKNYIECSEERHQPSHVVCSTESSENYVVNPKANCMVKLCGLGREQHSIENS